MNFKLLKKNGLTEKDLKKTDVPDEERITILEDAFAELCEYVFNEGGENDG